jgi:hypothetical protein
MSEKQIFERVLYYPLRCICTINPQDVLAFYSQSGNLFAASDSSAVEETRWRSGEKKL